MTGAKIIVILLLILIIFVVFLPSFQTPVVQAHELSPLQDLHLNTLHGLSWCGQNQHHLTGRVWGHDTQEWERLCQDGEWEKTGWLSMWRGYRLFDEYEILLLQLFFFFFYFLLLILRSCIREFGRNKSGNSSGAVWESRWPSWAVRPNESSGFRGLKAILNHASALVSVCP